MWWCKAGCWGVAEAGSSKEADSDQVRPADGGNSGLGWAGRWQTARLFGGTWLTAACHCGTGTRTTKNWPSAGVCVLFVWCVCVCVCVCVRPPADQREQILLPVNGNKTHPSPAPSNLFFLSLSLLSLPPSTLQIPTWSWHLKRVDWLSGPYSADPLQYPLPRNTVRQVPRLPVCLSSVRARRRCVLACVPYAPYARPALVAPNGSGARGTDVK
ncbi:hypothetical protein GGS23DRAFT_523104 [Durotheca rogersii]|uniref:uncharacterized protein n=1 Tax=Durotheca rogersii TaxID=419775 RepID=UPI00221E9955|nr:uncharacterized protein GGS23DRAFT_523104 [Durotheca rogersii]KAI5863967.1 hypothetical protein GGS23DRAFT_523104 [Durotheca rogersii]